MHNRMVYMYMVQNNWQVARLIAQYQKIKLILNKKSTLLYKRSLII